MIISLQRGGSRVGGFPDLNGLPWEPSEVRLEGNPQERLLSAPF
ncbi:hypothetical protein [Dendronalium phyllosphericum]|nr:hypothetical protein [Dendronalium phyllosphericum]